MPLIHHSARTKTAKARRSSPVTKQLQTNTELHNVFSMFSLPCSRDQVSAVPVCVCVCLCVCVWFQQELECSFFKWVI